MSSETPIGDGRDGGAPFSRAQGAERRIESSATSTSRMFSAREGSPGRTEHASSVFAAASTSETAARAMESARNGKVELYPTHRRAREHRCNDRLEDVVQALFEGNPLLTVPPAWNLFMRCMRSEVGNEPTDPFLYHTPTWLEESRRRERGKRGRGWFGGGG